MTITGKKWNLAKDIPTVAQLNQLLPQAQVFISWWGQKMVIIPKYNETVPINTLAQKYFHGSLLHVNSSHFIRKKPHISQDYQDFLTEIFLLYERCDKQLEKTKIYKYLVPSQEWKVYFNWMDLESRIRAQSMQRARNR